MGRRPAAPGRRRRLGALALATAGLFALAVAPAASATTWLPPVTVSAGDVTAGPSAVPDLALDARGDAVATWVRTAAADGSCPCTVRAATRAAGGSFHDPVSLSTAAQATGVGPRSSVAMDAAGDAIVVWDVTQAGVLPGTSQETVYAAVRPAGGAFGPPKPISSAARVGTSAAVAMDAAGDAVVLFGGAQGLGSGDVEAVRRPAGGAFATTPQVLTASGDDVPSCCTHRNLAMSPDGHAVAAFDVCSGATPCDGGVPLPGQEAVEAAVAPPGGPFGAPVAVSQTVANTGTGPPFEDVSGAAIDDQGDAAVALEDQLSDGTTTARVASADGGGAFGAAVRLGDAGAGSTPLVAIDARRETVATWLTGQGSAPAALESAVRPHGGAFGAPSRLGTGIATAALATSSDAEGASGDTLAGALVQGPSGGFLVGAVTRPAGGAFGPPAAIDEAASGTASRPLAAALDRAGDPALAWIGADGAVRVALGSAAPPQRTLTVASTGSGAGTVRSAPAGIDCGATCAHAYAEGTAVTLTATPASGSDFAGWTGGGCSGTGTCTVALTADTTVTATFAPAAAPPPGTPPPGGQPPQQQQQQPGSAPIAPYLARVVLGTPDVVQIAQLGAATLYARQVDMYRPLRAGRLLLGLAVICPRACVLHAGARLHLRHRHKPLHLHTKRLSLGANGTGVLLIRLTHHQLHRVQRGRRGTLRVRLRLREPGGNGSAATTRHFKVRAVPRYHAAYHRHHKHHRRHQRRRHRS